MTEFLSRCFGSCQKDSDTEMPPGHRFVLWTWFYWIVLLCLRFWAVFWWPGSARSSSSPTTWTTARWNLLGLQIKFHFYQWSMMTQHPCLYSSIFGQKTFMVLAIYIFYEVVANLPFQTISWSWLVQMLIQLIGAHCGGRRKHNVQSESGWQGSFWVVQDKTWGFKNQPTLPVTYQTHFTYKTT